MQISDILSGPLVYVGLIGGMIALFIYLRFGNNSSTGERKTQNARAIVFLRNNSFFELESVSFDGLVSYGIGGFMELIKSAMFLYYGRPFSIFRQTNLGSKKRTPIYLAHINRANPLDPHADDFIPPEIDMEEFKLMKSVALEREINRGKTEAGKRSTNDLLMAVSAFAAAMIMVLAWAAVIILPMTPLPPGN